MKPCLIFQFLFLFFQSKMNHLLAQFLVTFNAVLILTQGALINHPNSIPLTDCQRGCLTIFPGCRDYFDNTSQCLLLKSCTQSCYGEFLGHTREDNEGKREVVKKSCMSKCDAERYMCSFLSDSISGVHICNRANFLCRQTC